LTIHEMLLIIICILLRLCDRNILKLTMPLKKAKESIWRKLTAWSQLFDCLKWKWRTLKITVSLLFQSLMTLSCQKDRWQ